MQDSSQVFRLQFPDETHRCMYDELLESLQKNGETLKHPDGTFDYHTMDYDAVLTKVKNDREGAIPGRVPATTLFFVDTDKKKLLGAINIRHHIDHPNLHFRNGHIGYGIRPDERNKGYGTKILQLGLLKAAELGIPKILITCNSANEASQKIIEKNGGIFESEQKDSNGEKFKRYWIEII